MFYLDCLHPEIIDFKIGKRLLKSDVLECKRIDDEFTCIFTRSVIIEGSDNNKHCSRVPNKHNRRPTTDYK